MKKSICVLSFNLICLSALAQPKTYDTIPYALDYHLQRLAIFKEEPFPKGKVVFVGDSHIEFGNWRKSLKDSTIVNRGIAGDNTFGVLARLQEIIDRKPSKLFLEIGINDISQNIPEEVVAKNIFMIVKRVKAQSPDTKIFVLSILPTNKAVKAEYPDAFNKSANSKSINQQLKTNAKRMAFKYIDLYENFQDKEGELDMKYAEKDGLHLNARGYKLLVDLLIKN